MIAAGVVYLIAVADVRADDPVDSAIEVQLFEAAIGPRSFITVNDAQLSATRQLSLDFLVTYLTNPFVIYNFDEGAGSTSGERTAVVEDLVAGQVSGAYGITPRLQVGASLPLVFRMSGEGLSPTDAMSGGGLTATGLGDLLVEGKLGLLDDRRIGLAATAGFTVPTSVGTDGGDYLGDNLPSLRGKLIGQWRSGGRFSAGANLGLIGRKSRDVYGSEIGSQLTYGVATAAALGERLSVVAEVFGRTGLISPDLGESPLEAGGGIRLQATRSTSILVGGGGGLVEGIGSPGLRLFAAASWAPDKRDGDGDGIPNDEDRCPLQLEDLDGDEDNDGCPDDDIDGDKRLDAEDRCPREAEDLDGFEDDDGCPELDNDRDTIVDFDDRCPDFKEDGKAPFGKDGCPASKRDSDDDGKSDDLDACIEETEDDDGFEDWDGCPEDNDKDGIADADDGCPMCPEDKDGKNDADGCPDFDDDLDGVPDGTDRCPAEAETPNGVDDFDGCPDSGGRQSAALDGNRLTFARALDFSRNDALATPTDVDPIALVMLAHPEVTSWRIVVAARKQKTDDATRGKSQRQAESLKARLVERGIGVDQLEAIGAVGDKPTIAIVALDRVSDEDGDGDGDGPREMMCPTNLRATQRTQPGTPDPR